MPLIGAHCSVAGGVHTAFDRGEQVGCDAIQIFTKSNRQWKAAPLKEKDVQQFSERSEETGMPVVAHASYLINLASPRDEIWVKSVEAYLIEMDRCRTLGIPYLVIHPGAHTGSGYTAGIERVAEALDREHEHGDESTMVLLEITAGTGTTLGSEMDHFREILARVRQPERIGVCFDTCHALGAGWDIRTPEGYKSVMQTFEEKIGLERIRCFHLNDSHHDLGSRRDRHAHIGHGACTLETFRNVLNDPRFVETPMLLETPKDDSLVQDAINIRVLRGLVDGCEEPVTEDNLDQFWDGVEPVKGKEER